MQAGRKRAGTRGKSRARDAEPGTDWARVKHEAKAEAQIPFEPGDGPYDPTDPAAVDAHWDQAGIRRGPGRPPLAVTRPTLNMRVDADVLAAVKATGPGWQTRINSLLREAVERGRLKR